MMYENTETNGYGHTDPIKKRLGRFVWDNTIQGWNYWNDIFKGKQMSSRCLQYLDGLERYHKL